MIIRRLQPCIALCLLRLLFAPVPARATLCYHDVDGDGYGDAGDLGTFTPNPFCDPGFADKLQV